MAIELPGRIAAYFAADRSKDAEAVVRCFAEDAKVTDEGHTYVGIDAIRRWKTEASAKYTYTVEPFAIAVDGDRTVVTAHLSGDFPGSPIDLRYAFKLVGDPIASMEIGL